MRNTDTAKKKTEHGLPSKYVTTSDIYCITKHLKGYGTILGLNAVKLNILKTGL